MFTSCIRYSDVPEVVDTHDKFKVQYYEEYFNAVEVLLDSLYERDYNNDIMWHDTVMETAEYEQYETIRDLINELC